MGIKLVGKYWLYVFPPGSRPCRWNEWFGNSGGQNKKSTQGIRPFVFRSFHWYKGGKVYEYLTLIWCCCCCSHVSIVAYGHGEFEVLLTPTEWVKVHAPQKFLQLSVDPHTSWNLLNYYLTLAIEYWQVCTLCHST